MDVISQKRDRLPLHHQALFRVLHPPLHHLRRRTLLALRSLQQVRDLSPLKEHFQRVRLPS